MSPSGPRRRFAGDAPRVLRLHVEAHRWNQRTRRCRNTDSRSCRPRRNSYPGMQMGLRHSVLPRPLMYLAAGASIGPSPLDSSSALDTSEVVEVRNPTAQERPLQSAQRALMDLAGTALIYVQRGSDLPKRQTSCISKTDNSQVALWQSLELLRNDTDALFALRRIVGRILTRLLAERFGVSSGTVGRCQVDRQPFTSRMSPNHIKHLTANPKFCVSSQGGTKLRLEGPRGLQQTNIAGLNQIRYFDSAAPREAAVQPTCHRTYQRIEFIHHLGRQGHATGRRDTVQSGRRTTHHRFHHPLRIEWRAQSFFSRCWRVFLCVR